MLPVEGGAGGGRGNINIGSDHAGQRRGCVDQPTPEQRWGGWGGVEARGGVAVRVQRGVHGGRG